MTRILILIVALCTLQSCSPEFNTPDARRGTAFFLRDATEMHGELFAVISDSVLILRSDLGEIESLRTITSIHYSGLEFVVFRNDASALLNGLGGTLGGTLLGAVAGLAIGSMADKSGWGGFIGLFYGGVIGSITGLLYGVNSGSNKVVAIESAADLHELQPFVRFHDAIEVRRFRGY